MRTSSTQLSASRPKLSRPLALSCAGGKLTKLSLHLFKSTVFILCGECGLVWFLKICVMTKSTFYWLFRPFWDNKTNSWHDYEMTNLETGRYKTKNRTYRRIEVIIILFEYTPAQHFNAVIEIWIKSTR